MTGAVPSPSAAAAHSERGLSEAVRRHGFACVRGIEPRQLDGLLSPFGRVLHVEEVVVRPDSRALVTSRRALPPHTDHHRAAYIAWHCIRQTDQGGDSVLVDARAVWARLTDTHRAALTRVMLFEHSIFPGDDSTHPMVTLNLDGTPRFYYSYWLADRELTPEQKEAFDAFSEEVGAGPTVQLRLEPGDLLAIDNRRMLHGRTAIEGRPTRWLRRYWLSGEELTAG